MLVVAFASGCPKRTDARAREAWASARGGGVAGGKRPDTPAGGDARAPELEKIGWDRVAEVVHNAVAAMRTSPDDAALGKLAARWCSVEPEPRPTRDGNVRVCSPEPPVVASGTSFSLEMGGRGVIGLVTTDVSQKVSERIAAEARKAAQPYCMQPWTSATEGGAEDPSFHTCPAEGGPLLSVGRFPKRPGSARWLVSVAVLSPG